MNGKMKIDERRKKILELLSSNGIVYVSELCKLLNATPVTIRSDLSALEENNQLIRISGGALLPPPQITDTRASKNTIKNYEAKSTIANAVANLVSNGDTLFMNSGTTTSIIAEALKSKKNLNIVTNSIDIALSLGDEQRVILLGGEINSQYRFTYGGDAQEQLSKFCANYAILSVDGINENCEISTYHAEEAIIDKIMINRAKNTIVAVDDSKIGRSGFSFVSGAFDGLKIVTNSNKEILNNFIEKNIEVIKV